jgi:hypothetical protein
MKRHLKALAGLSLGLGLIGCVGEIPTEPTAAGLTIQASDATRFAGVHIAGNVKTSFEALKMDDTGQFVTSVLRLGDKVFEWNINRAEGYTMVDGHEAIISQEEMDALGVMKADLAKTVMEDETRTPQMSNLYAQVNWLYSGKATGLPEHRFTRVMTLKPQVNGETGYGYGADTTSCASGQGCYGQGFCSSCTASLDRSGNVWEEAWTQPWWSGGNHNVTWWAFTNGSLGCYRDHKGCPGNYDPPCGDNSGQSCGNPKCSKGGCEWDPNNSTYGDWSCQGQCGIGCQSTAFGRFQDCYEHDVCTYYYVNSACDTDKASAAGAFSDSATYKTCDGGAHRGACLNT